MSIVEIRGLQKSYGKNKALKGIDLNIEEGMIYGLLGPNGSGKSTMINILSGLIGFDCGSCKILGVDIKKDKKLIQQQIGVVPQEYSIYDDLKAKENICFFGKLYGLKKSDITSKVDNILSLVDLGEYKNSFPSSFSGGMKRRLNIACSLIHNPKLLIMDEPTASLDPISRDTILETVKKLNHNGCTIIYTSHYLEEIEALCHRATIINKGDVIAEGTPNDLKNLITNRNRITLILSKNYLNIDNEVKSVINEKTSGTKNTFNEHKTVVYVRNTESIRKLEIECDNPAEILEILLPYIRKKGILIKDIQVSKISLEDVFLKLIPSGNS